MFKNLKDIYDFYIKKRLSQMWLFLGIALLLALVGAPVPYLFGYIIDQVIPAKDTTLLLYVVIVLTVLMLSEVLLSYINTVFTFKVRKQITTDTIHSMLHGMLDMPYEKRTSIHSGELISRLTRDVDELYNILPFGIANLVYCILSSVIMLGILIFLNWKISAMLLLLIPFVIIIYFLFNKALWELAFKDAHASADNMKFLNEVIVADYEIKIYGAENKFKKLAMKAVAFFQKTHFQRLVINEKMNASVKLFPVIASLIIWYVASMLAIKEELTIGLIVTYTTTIGLVIPALMQIVEHLSEYPNQMAVFRRIQEYAIHKDANGVNIEANGALSKPDRIRPITSLYLKNIDFKYNGSKNKIFDNFSYEFEKGKKYLIKAPNGFGKSTLFSLIANQLIPSSGQICLDKAPLVSLNNIHKYITLLPQQVNIISDTIRVNLSFGDPSITDLQITDMLIHLGLADWLNDKEHGLDHVLSLAKQQLSGGQIQKIGLARAFLRKTKILLLDEPTNNLDNHAVNNLIDTLDNINEDTVCLIISHDDRIYSHVDKILNLSFED